MTWDGRELTSLTNTNQTISYTYGSDGYRTSKTVNGETIDYTYIEGKLTLVDVVFGELYFNYDDKGNLGRIKYTKTDGTYTNNFIVVNSRGDVEAIYDTNGSLLARYTYDTWGNIISVKDASGNSITDETHIANLNPIRYRGYQYDEETGFYYLNSRYYDPEVGRFINADDIGIISIDPTSLYDKNLYAYCDNNPVSRSDSQGDFWETAFDVISLGASIVEVAINPTDLWAWAGLVGDVVDLTPFVTGLGESVDVYRHSVNISQDVIEVAKTVDISKDIRKGLGSYEIFYEGGTSYVGKGGFNRAIQSAMEHDGDVIAIRWKSAPTTLEAFVDEYLMQYRRINNLGDGALKNSLHTLKNRIWSPGRKYFGR